MTSPGLKRPLEYDVSPHNGGSEDTTSGTSPTTAASGPLANSSTNGVEVGVSKEDVPGEAGTGNNKRRCVSNFAPKLGATDGSYSSSPFKDSSTILTPLSENIASMIEDELSNNDKTTQESNQTNTTEINLNCIGGSEIPSLTIRQTQLICEKLIKDREQRLRDEYDRILACKLAEQYDLLAKANYLNSYVESRMPSTTPTPTITPPQANNPSINSALAVAFSSMQRSAAAVPMVASPFSDRTCYAALSPNAFSTSRLAFDLQQKAAAVAIQAHQRGVPANNNSAIPSGPVLLASNLDEQLATPEALFTLFGVFGDVVRVKILFNKKDNALIQMADANQAQVAQSYLDKQKVFGRLIRVTRSKHQLVQMPRDANQSDAGLTKDFTNSPLHRFKIPGSRNYLNIYPPSNTLHISNIPATIDENDIHRAFKEACGFEFSSFKFFPKDKKMALMKFNTIEQATIALIKMHNFPINDDNNLRVSFSKSLIQQ